ncbi:MAG: hypothetical protein JO312_09625 [Hyphomicrobiales bacterium]|nr:hypothetical protein [Hyphomicrobiales bacterium]
MMVRSVQLMGAALLALAFAAPPADAQTTQTPAIHARAKHHARKKAEPEGRQITVHKATPSYLTLGGVAAPAVTSTNNYVIDTFNQPTPIEGTFAGMRGREALGRYDNPGFPLFRF